MDNGFYPARDTINRERHGLSLAFEHRIFEDADRLIRRTRTGLGLSQTEFARRFCMPPGTLRDWEQARSTPPDFAIAYVKAIARHPDMVAEEIA